MYIIFTLIIIVCYLIVKFVKKKYEYFKDTEIPCLPVRSLLLNLIAPFVNLKHVTEIIQDTYDINPEAKYVGTFDMFRPTIMLRDLELIKNITIKHFDSFMDRNAVINDSLDPIFGNNLFFLTGDKWKEIRNVLTPTFTGSKMKMMHELMVDCAKSCITYLSEQSKSANAMVDTKDFFSRYTCNVTASCAFGISVDSLRDPKNEFYVQGRAAINFNKSAIVKFILADSFPKLAKLFKVKIVSERIAKFFENIVRMTVQMREEKGIRRPDMLQLMIDAGNKEKGNVKMNYTEMTAHAFIFFFGGLDSTSTQMCLIAHELATNLEIQKKLQDEIDDVSKKSNGNVTYEAINDMPYLDAVFNESLRKHMQFALLERKCMKPFELPPVLPGCKPFTLEPGMVVWIPGSAIHSDPKYYDNPEKFDPERYYQKKVTINDVTNLGFGIGPRSCIGNRFAILETKILFFYLLSKFTLKPNKKTAIPFVYSKSTFMLQPEGGYWLAIEPRTE